MSSFKTVLLGFIVIIFAINWKQIIFGKTSSSSDVSNSLGPLPNLLIAGAPKAGTTSIAKLLFSSPEVCRAQTFPGEPYPDFEKEVNFFNQPWRYFRGEDFYRKRYEHCTRNHKYVLDATPNYLVYAKRIHDLYQRRNQLESLKIIFTLREPVQREVSQFNHFARVALFCWLTAKSFTSNGILSFEEFIQRWWLPHFVTRRSFSFYYDHLQTWFKLFDRKQILILSFDELQTDPDRLVQRILDFLGNDITVSSARLSKANTSHLKMNQTLETCPDQQKLWTFFEEHNNNLYRLLDEHKGPPMEQQPFPKFEFKCARAADPSTSKCPTTFDKWHPDGVQF